MFSKARSEFPFDLLLDDKARLKKGQRNVYYEIKRPKTCLIVEMLKARQNVCADSAT